jgi:hypothetical protein
MGGDVLRDKFSDVERNRNDNIKTNTIRCTQTDFNAVLHIHSNSRYAPFDQDHTLNRRLHRRYFLLHLFTQDEILNSHASELTPLRYVTYCLIIQGDWDQGDECWAWVGPGVWRPIAVVAEGWWIRSNKSGVIFPRGDKCVIHSHFSSRTVCAWRRAITYWR